MATSGMWLMFAICDSAVVFVAFGARALAPLLARLFVSDFFELEYAVAEFDRTVTLVESLRRLRALSRTGYALSVARYALSSTHDIVLVSRLHVTLEQLSLALWALHSRLPLWYRQLISRIVRLRVH